MKTSVLLLLWLLLMLSLKAQLPSATIQERPLPCRPCCNAPHEPGLLLILAPELAEQCPSCTLIAVAQCPITDKDFAAQQTVLRYTLRDPAGVTSTYFAPMTKTLDGWDLQLYPPVTPAPPCDPSSL
jgi:hypothetical protein